MSNTDGKSAGFLKGAFGKVAGYAAKLDNLLLTYPSKATGATGLCGDIMFLAHTVTTGNHLGTAAALIGAYASVHLVRYGDPKITEEQKLSYVEPQDTRNMISWVKHPEQYPWEYLGLLRTGSMSAMLAGGMVGSSFGEIGYAGFALAGYAIKMGVAQKPEGSVEVPAESHGVTKLAYQTKAFIQEHPNSAVGILWHAALVPYTAEALVEQDPLKLGSALLWFLPTVLMMYSSKRAQTLPENQGPRNNHP